MKQRWFRHGMFLSGMKQRMFLVFCVSLLLFGLLLTALDQRVRPVAEKLALAELDNAVTGEVNALCQQLSEEGILSYEELVQITYDPTGAAAGMVTNMDTMNALRMTVGKGVSEVLNGQIRRRVKIPIGAALNWNLFTTLGPELSVQLLHVGQVGISFENEFHTIGIDQTAHTIHMMVTADVLLMLPGGFSNQTITCDVPLAESLLMGEVPQSYTNLVCGEPFHGVVSDATAIQNES